MKPQLTIFTTATDKKDFIKCIESIRNAQIINKKIQLIICYTLEKEWVKKCVSIQLESKKNVHVTLKKIDTYFPYPVKFIGNHYLLGLFRWRFFRRRTEPYRITELYIQRMAFVQGYRYIKGKYLLMLPERAKLKKDFWKHCIEPLEKNTDIMVLVGSVERMNADKAAFLNRPVCSKTMFFEKGKAVFPFLHGTQHAEKIIIIRCKKRKPVPSKYLWGDFSSDKYIYEHSLTVWMAFLGSVLQHEYVAEMEVTREEVLGYESLESAVLRLAFLKGYNWRFESHRYEKYDTKVLKEAYKKALETYGESLREIERFYSEQGKQEIALKYRALINAVTD